MTKQIHLAAHFPGVNNTTVWSDPAASGSHIEFASFRAVSRQTAERGQVRLPVPRRRATRLREQNGQDLRPRRGRSARTPSPILAAPGRGHRAAPGLTAARSTPPSARPYEVRPPVRQRSTISPPAAAPRGTWSPPGTPSPARTSAAGRLPAPGADRYERARTFLAHGVASLSATPGAETRSSPTRHSRPCSCPIRRTGRPSAHHDAYFDIASGQFNVPRTPQGRPVIFQAGDSDEGRGFAAADGRRHLHPPRRPGGRAGLLRRRQGPAAQVRPGRRGELLILPAATFVLGRQHDAEAADLARQVRRHRVSAADRARRSSSSCGTTDLPGYDAGRGRCPRSAPTPGEHTWSRKRPGQRPAVRQGPRSSRWARLSGGPGPRPGTCRPGSSIIEVTSRQSFVGSPATIAAHDRRDWSRPTPHGGYILVPHITPGRPGCRSPTPVVPLLQERGVFRADCTGTHAATISTSRAGSGEPGVPRLRRRPARRRLTRGPPHAPVPRSSRLIAHAPDPRHGRAEIRPRHRFREVIWTARGWPRSSALDGFGVGERHERPFVILADR